MNLNELIEALTELKESGKAVEKLPVVFYRRRKQNKSIDRIKVYSDNSDGKWDRIELISVS